MSSLDFLPGSPCLANAGTKVKQLASGYTLDVQDSLDDIFSHMRLAANIFQTGARVEYSFSALRPAGSAIASSNRESSGAVSFMQVFDQAGAAVKRGGLRQAGQRAVLRVDHPDIFSLVAAKAKGKFAHLSLSIGVSDAFMQAVVKDGSYWLRDHEGKKVQQVKARKVFDYL